MKRSTKIIICLAVFVISIYYSGWIKREEFTPIDEITVHFLDVGQADCEIIQLPDGRNVIIDGGGNSTEKELVKKIKRLGIEKFEWLIVTHPHEDHIGGLDKVINSFEIGCVYMPNAVSGSKTFEAVLDAIETKGVKVREAKAGQVIIDEENIRLVLVAPNGSNYEETNDYSAVARLTYGIRSFLFMGDAEAFSEGEILKNRMDIGADVLKVGHHGSSSSTTSRFLSKVNPDYAIIEVGKDNSYGHPHREVLKALEDIKTYRTDIHGDITAVCDGVDITITTENSEDKND